MAKRLTDTDQWKKEWFILLPPQYKCFWEYLKSTCDYAGIWEVNFSFAQMYIDNRPNSEKLDIKNLKEIFKYHVVEIDNGRKWYLLDFVKFQYGEKLNIGNKFHEKIIYRLKEYGLIDRYFSFKSGSYWVKKIDLFNQTEYFGVQNDTKNTSLIDEHKTLIPPQCIDGLPHSVNTPYHTVSLNAPKVEIKNKNAGLRQSMKKNESLDDTVGGTVVHTVKEEEEEEVKEEEEEKEKEKEEGRHSIQNFVEELPNVSRMQYQITFEECEKLVKLHGESLVRDVLMDMENSRNIAKKYNSVYLTCNSWCKNRDIKLNGKNGQLNGKHKKTQDFDIKFEHKPDPRMQQKGQGAIIPPSNE